MLDCSKELHSFHNEKVRLSEKMQDKLREHREVNRERVKNGLKKKEKPKPVEFLIQGSYAMETIIQHPKNDYDIDDGVVFNREDLLAPKGGELSPLQVKQMVCEAVQDDRFKRPPEVRTNCVRVYYEEGHNVDIPAYRKGTNSKLELAGVEWRESDARAVTEWFNQQVKNSSPDEDGEKRQMRRVVRLFKGFAKSRESWNMPSGLILSVLVNERYYPATGRDDKSFHDSIKNINLRLQGNLSVRHPVVGESLTIGDEDSQMIELRAQLEKALEWLQVLHDPACTKKAGLKAWGKVFNTDYFNRFITDDSKGSGPTIITVTGDQPKDPVKKEGGGRYG